MNCTHFLLLVSMYRQHPTVFIVKSECPTSQAPGFWPGKVKRLWTYFLVSWGLIYIYIARFNTYLYIYDLSVACRYIFLNLFPQPLPCAQCCPPCGCGRVQEQSWASLRSVSQSRKTTLGILLAVAIFPDPQCSQSFETVCASRVGFFFLRGHTAQDAYAFSCSMNK